MGKLGVAKMSWVIFAFCAVTAIASTAQTFKTLATFNNTDGGWPYAGLVQATNGNFYGATYAGGASNYGAIFEITPTGKLTTLYSFCSQVDCTDGEFPRMGLVQVTDGNLYGTTSEGGANDRGTIFKITPGGKLTTLYTLCSQPGCADGGDTSGLVQAGDGNLFGTTATGGATGSGIFFRMTPQGNLTTLYNFCSQAHCTDGANPAGLVLAKNGSFYGVATAGGANGYGTVFKITPGGTLTTLYSFCSQTNCTDGGLPNPGLIQAANANFYGTTYDGGSNDSGTVFEITPAGKLTTLYSFCTQPACLDGQNPAYAGLIQATNGNFYGTTISGGSGATYGGNGTVFEVTVTGNLTTLYSFCPQTGCLEGQNPDAALMQSTNGNLYGTTPSGGADDIGTVFALSVALGPFVETLPTSGKVGSRVLILGNNLSGATSVTFDVTASTFKVVSASEITTTVPVGAITGAVNVTTPVRRLKSNVAFRVVP
jgi:uncharacterized repeat protein (TIGR03803 family)